jgi:hypothetical protein
MSDTILSVIPTDPRWQPDPARAEHARSVVAGLLPMERPGFHELKVTWHAQVAVVDCGENLQRISCPHCAAEIDTEWWRDLLEERFRLREGFDDLTATLPCCRGSTSLTDLDYDWPCGFARFEIEIWNPDRDWFTDEELVSIAQAIGHPVRQIMAHI